MKFKNAKFDRRERNFVEIKGREDSGIPTKEIGSQVSTFETKAFKDLKFGVIATKVDPNADASVSSKPYAVISKTNSVIGGKYPGTDNLNGNILPQLMTSSRSELVNCFDSGVLKLKLNYLYLNLENKSESTATNIYMGQAISEALSKSAAEMTTQLAFASWFADAPELEKMDANNRGYILALYQAVLQNAATVIGKFVQLRSIQQHLIDMGFNREANFTMEIFGLLNKRTLVAKMDALATTIFGEYFDMDWYKQINTLTMVPSRKSEDMRNPLLTILGTHVLPDITVYTDQSKATKLFSTKDFAWIDTSNGSKVYTQDMICDEIISRLDQRSILEWSRQKFVGKITTTAQAYFNEIDRWVDRLTAVMAVFKSQFDDLRTYLRIMTRAGLNQWVEGVRFDASLTTKAPLVFNKICQDVFASYLNSPSSIKFDDETQRWTFYTVWNEFTGIPEYDKINGGAFLAFSMRKIESDLPVTDSRLLIPKLFRVIDKSVTFTARSGYTAVFSYTEKDQSAIKADPILARLLPFDSMKVSFRLPTVSLLDSGKIPQASSSAYEVMQTVFGYGQIEVEKGKYNIAISRDVICFIDVQLSDVNNQMLVFVRAFAPFKVWTTSGERTIGFGK